MVDVTPPPHSPAPGPGTSGEAYTDWLDQRGGAFRDGVPSNDPSHRTRNILRGRPVLAFFPLH